MCYRLFKARDLTKSVSSFDAVRSFWVNESGDSTNDVIDLRLSTEALNGLEGRRWNREKSCPQEQSIRGQKRERRERHGQN